MKLFFLLFLSVIGFSAVGQSQDHYVIASQGNFQTSTSFSVSWTIGEIITESTTLNGRIITQGFQQPFQHQPGPNRPSADLVVKLYPNPFESQVRLEIQNAQNEYRLEVLDLLGRPLWSGVSHSASYLLRMDNFPSALYLLRVSIPHHRQAIVLKLTKM